MKIVHLNTHSHGGAAVVARRLHRAALASGLDSTFITKYGRRSAGLLELVRAGATHPKVYALGKLVERRLQHPNLAQRPDGFEVFSPLNSGKRFHDCVDEADPAVIHLHWVAGFVDHSAFFERNAKRKFVWTLHDMNPFTGGCHHADGCAGFASGCSQCPQLAGTIDRDYSARVLRGKADALARLGDDQLTIVSPSRWLLELSRKSAVTSRFRHVHIANPSLEGGTADGSTAFKLRHHIPCDKKIVLFVSENLRNPRKGIPLLLEAVGMMRRKSEVHLIGVGRRTEAPVDLPVTFTGRIADDDTLAGYFSVADAVVSPAVMENSPLTLIEGQSCGAPAVGFDVGGVRELITDATGTVVRNRTPFALAEALEAALFDRVWDREAIKRIAARHAPTRVMAAYRAVYEQLVAS